MRASSFILALFSCSILACSSSDDTPNPTDQDSGVGADSSTTDSHVADSGHDTATTDSAKTDAPSDGDATSTDSTSDAPTDAPSDTPTDATSDGSTDAGDGTTPCDALAHDCPTGFYCDSATCALGTCKPIPASPSATLDPVCACTGVTFWNAEQANAAGETVSSTGACDPAAVTTHHCGGSLAAHCDGTDTCIADHSASGTCPAPTIGSTCWRIPAGITCAATDTKTYRDCGDDACHSYCEVLMSGDTFYSDSTCP